MKHKIIILFLIVVFIIINVIGFTKVFIYTDLFSEIINPVNDEINDDLKMKIQKKIYTRETANHYVVYIGNYTTSDNIDISFEYYSDLTKAMTTIDNNNIIIDIPEPKLDKQCIKPIDEKNKDYIINETLCNEIDDYVWNSQDEPKLDLGVKDTMTTIVKFALTDKELNNRKIIVRYY